MEQLVARRAQHIQKLLRLLTYGKYKAQRGYCRTAITLKALKHGWEVLKPIGDRLPYDIVFDVNGFLIKIQVKSAWLDAKKNNYVVDNRKTKTNRRNVKHYTYESSDFDFAILYIEDLDVSYIMPCDVFLSYGSEIHLVVTDKRQRKPKSWEYRDAWNLILQRAALMETSE